MSGRELATVPGFPRDHEDGGVFLTDRARMDYGALIPPSARLPSSR